MSDTIFDQTVARQTNVAGDNVDRDKTTVIGNDNVVGDHNIVTIINNLVQGVRRLPTDYATRIQNFLVEYLGTPERPVPFGGRAAALAELDAWLDDASAPPYLLLTAPAGRGKSALLARWSQALAQRENAPAVIFLPVSVRFRTNLSTVVFASLAARLAYLHGDEVPLTSESAEIWRGMASSCLARPLPDGRPLLVLLDGVDEAADWDVGADLFPATPPPGLRIVLAARQTAERTTEAAWRRALGWERPDLARALDLTPLDRPGVANVLERMGVPLDVLTRDVDVTAELHRLSAGDPLLVHLYVDDLWARGEAASRLRPEDLRRIKRGYEGYFEKWWEDQECLWKEQQEDPLQRPEVERLFYTLATAMGPLQREDLARLSELSSLRFHQAVKPLSRLVIVTAEQGYVFTHPKLGQYFWDEMFEEERQRWEQKFLDWGKTTLEALNTKTLPPREAPVYLVQYYGAHLERAHAPDTTLYALVSEGWLRAWEALEGTHDGFLGDVARAWARAEAAHDLALQVKCALCRASVAALSANIPPELLALAVEHDVLTPVQGLVIAKQTPYEAQRAEALAAIAPHFPPDLFTEALTTAREIKKAEYSAKALTALAPHLAPELLEQALTEVLTTITEIYYPGKQMERLRALAPHLPPDSLEIALAMAYMLFKTGGDEEEILDCREEALTALLELTERLPPAKREEYVLQIWRTTLQVLADNPDDDFCLGLDSGIKYLMKMLPLLPNSLQEQAGEELLEAAKRTDVFFWPAVLEFLVNRFQVPFLQQAVKTVLEIDDAHTRTGVLLNLIPRLPEPQVYQLLEQIQIAEKDQSTILILAAFASRLLELGHYQRALKITQRINYPEVEAETKPTPESASLADSLAGIAECVREEYASYITLRILGDLLYALGYHSPESQLWEMLEFSLKIPRGWYRESALAGLIPRLVEQGFQEQAFELLQQISNPLLKTVTLKNLISISPEIMIDAALKQTAELRRENILELSLRLAETRGFEEAILLFERIDQPVEDPSGFDELLSNLPTHLIDKLLNWAQDVGDKESEAMILARLGRPEEAWAKVQQTEDYAQRKILEQLAAFWLDAGNIEYAIDAILQFLQVGNYDSSVASSFARRLVDLGYPSQAALIVTNIDDPGSQIKALLELASQMSGAFQEQALQSALIATRAVKPDRDRITVLLKIAESQLSNTTSKQALEEALTLARAIEDKEDSICVTAALVPHMPASPQQTALQEVLCGMEKIRDIETRAMILAHLAPCLPKELREEILLNEIKLMRDADLKGTGHWHIALAELAPHSSEPLILEALQTVGTQSDKYQTQKSCVKQANLQLADMVGLHPTGDTQNFDLLDGIPLAHALISLTPYLSLTEIPAILENAQILHAHHRDRVSAAVSLQFAKLGETERALKVAEGIDSDLRRSMTLGSLVPYMSEKQLEEIEKRVGEGTAFSAFVIGHRLESELAESLSPESYEIFIETMKEHNWQEIEEGIEDVLIFNFATLAPSEIESQLSILPNSALLRIWQSSLRKGRLNLLHPFLVPRLLKLPPTDLYQLWRLTLSTLTASPRPVFFANFTALAPIIHALGGEEAILETFHAIQDVCTWWP